MEMDDFILSTDRLTLRKMTTADVTNLLEIFSDLVAMKYYPSTKDERETLEWIKWTHKNYEEYGVGLWIVEEKETSQFLGQCGIVPQEVDGKIEMEIGYLFVRRFWGNGYATEAALACKNYGFQNLKLSRLVSLPVVNNIPSTKVAERIGMRAIKTINKWGKDVFVYVVDK